MVLLIHCAEGGKKALSGMVRLGYRLAGDIRTFELPCSGRINETMLLEILQEDVAGIIVLGCRKDNCKFMEGNLRAESRVNRVKTLLKGAGISKKNVKMLYAAPDEGKRLYEAIHNFYEGTKAPAGC